MIGEDIQIMHRLAARSGFRVSMVDYVRADHRAYSGMSLREDNKPARSTWSPDPIVDQVSRKIRAAVESGAAAEHTAVY